MPSETLRQQVVQELAYHQQECERLSRVLALLEGSNDSKVPVTVGVDTGKPTAAKKRTQPESAKARISAYQQSKWAAIRAIQSGVPVKDLPDDQQIIVQRIASKGGIVPLESLSPDSRAVLEHIAGIRVHAASRAAKPEENAAKEDRVMAAFIGNVAGATGGTAKARASESPEITPADNARQSDKSKPNWRPLR